MPFDSLDICLFNDNHTQTSLPFCLREISKQLYFIRITHPSSQWVSREVFDASLMNASTGYFAGLLNHQVALCCYLVTRYSVLLIILVWRKEWYTKYAGLPSTHLLRGPVGQLEVALVLCRHKGRDWFGVAFVSGPNGGPFLFLFQFLLTFTLWHCSSHFLFLLKSIIEKKKKKKWPHKEVPYSIYLLGVSCHVSAKAIRIIVFSKCI